MSKPEFAFADFTAEQLNALVEIIGPDNVPAILCGELVVELKQFTPLTRVATVQVEAVERFVFSKHKEAANIGYMGHNFKNHFGDLMEENVPAATIAVSRLEKDSVDRPILNQLGDKAEIKLAHFVTLLKRQSQGEEDDVLLTDGSWNVAYIRDARGEPWAVYALWLSRYWQVDARLVGGGPGPWRAGRQILSCDS